MDNRAVGVFDSGLGGLTAVRSIMDILPGQDIVYLGDTARVPYGPRGRDVIIQYTLEHMAFMARRGVKAMVAACGTMSAIGMDALLERSPVPVLGVVGPSAALAVETCANKRIGVISTAACADSGAYQARIAALCPEAAVMVRACPLFVPLVEAGRVHKGDPVIETVASEYLEPLRDAGVDTLLLGCTHYPLIHGIIADFMGPGVTLVDSGAAVAAALKKHLEDTDALPSPNRRGETRFFVTDSAEQFSKLGPLFLNARSRGQNTTFGIADRVDILKD